MFLILGSSYDLSAFHFRHEIKPSCKDYVYRYELNTFGSACTVRREGERHALLTPIKSVSATAWVAHTSCFLRCMRPVRTHDKLSHVCATPSMGTRLNKESNTR
jgi:hypothetical protein